MRAAPLKLVALCAVGAVLGGISMQLLLQSGLVAGSQSPQAIVGGDSARSERFDTPQSLEPADSAETAATRAQSEIEARYRENANRASSADAIVRLAATDPRGAIDRALAIEAYWLGLDTTERVAVVWAERLPNEALAFVQAARELDPRMRSAVRSRILEVWSATNPGGALGYLLGRDGQNLFFFDERTGRRFVRELSARIPYELLYAANGLPKGLVRSELRTVAIAGLVERDLAFALREAALAEPGLERQQWVTAIRRIHPGRTDELGLCDLDPPIDPVCQD